MCTMRCHIKTHKHVYIFQKNTTMCTMRCLVFFQQQFLVRWPQLCARCAANAAHSAHTCCFLKHAYIVVVQIAVVFFEHVHIVVVHTVVVFHMAAHTAHSCGHLSWNYLNGITELLQNYLNYCLAQCFGFPRVNSKQPFLLSKKTSSTHKAHVALKRALCALKRALSAPQKSVRHTQTHHLKRSCESLFGSREPYTHTKEPLKTTLKRKELLKNHTQTHHFKHRCEISFHSREPYVHTNEPLPLPLKTARSKERVIRSNTVAGACCTQLRPTDI